jgi:hypothetical protein
MEEITKVRFDGLMGSTRSPLTLIAGIEREWYSEQNEKVLGVIVQDAADDDFPCIVLGRDRIGRYRAMHLKQNHWDDEAEETMTNDERMQRESSLIATIRKKLPDFAKACADDAELVLLHQDAFAADYQDEEIRASRHGDQVRWAPWERSACDWEESANSRSRHNPVTAVVGTGTRKMRKEFRSKLNGDESRDNATASFTLPFDTREVWGKAKVPVKVTINGYTWRSTVGNRGGIQYMVVNANAASRRRCKGRGFRDHHA